MHRLQRLASLRRGVRFASEWLQGRPPTVDLNAGTIAASFYRNVRNYDLASRDAVVAPQQDVKFTFQHLGKHAYAYALGLLDGLGLKKGDRVIIYTSQELESLVLQYATTLAGGVVVAVDPTTVSPSALPALAASTGARVIFSSNQVGPVSLLTGLQEAFSEELAPFQKIGGLTGYEAFTSKRLRALKHIVLTGTEGVDGFVRMMDLPIWGEGGEYTHDDIAVAQSRISKDDAAYHYGSQVVTGAHVLGTSTAAAKALALTSSDALVLTAPLTSHFGLAAGALAANLSNAKLVLPSKVFDARKTLQAIQDQRASVLVATASQVKELAAAAAASEGAGGGVDISSLRGGLVLSAGQEGGAAAAALGKAKLQIVSPTALPGKLF